MVATHIPNEVAKRVALAGIEVIPGQPVAPTFQLPGQFVANKASSLNQQAEQTGGYDQLVTPSKSPSTFDGTYGQRLTFEEFPQLMRVGLQSGGTGTEVDGSGGAAYQYRKSPRFDSHDVDAMTVQYGVPGRGFRSTGVRFNEWTVTMDADDNEGAWMFSTNLFVRDKRPLAPFNGVASGGGSDELTMMSAAWEPDEWVGAYVYLHPQTPSGQVRQVTGNTADTLTVSTPWADAPESGDSFRIAGMFEAGVPTSVTNETIPAAGTQVFVDPVGQLGETQVTGRVISSSVTTAFNLSHKRFLENALDEVSERVGVGQRIVTGQIRLEADRWYEYDAWDNLDALAIRFQQHGSQLTDDQRKRARIDIPRAILNEAPSEQERESNLTWTFGFVGYLPEEGSVIATEAINGLSQLP